MLPQENLNSFSEVVNVVVTLVISLISCFISISRRILKGHAVSFLWVISEFMSAILCGYIVYYSYPALDPYLPDYITPIIAITVAAHCGGRVFQEIEDVVIQRYKKMITSDK